MDIRMRVKNKTAIIHTDAVRRELAGNFLLASQLRKFGYEVAIASRVTTKILVKLVEVDLLLLSHPFTLSEKTLLKLAKSGVQIFVLDVEGHLGWEEAISTTYKENTNLNIFSGILVWNKWSKDWINNNRNIEKGKVSVTGSIRTSISSNILINNETETIGILGRFEFINIFDARHNFKLLVKHHSQGGYWRQFKLRRWKYDLDLFSVCLDVIELAIKSGKTVSIRPHPNENFDSYRIIEKYFDGKVIIDKEPDYLDWLSGIDVLIGATSTAFSEAYIAGVPIISLDKMIDDSYLDGYTEWEDVNATCAYFPENYEKISELLNTKRLKAVHSDEFDRHLENYYDIDSGNAIDRVISIITKENSITSRTSFYSFAWLRLASNSIDFFIIIFIFLKSIFDNDIFFKYKNYHYNKFIHKPSKFMTNIINMKKNEK